MRPHRLPRGWPRVFSRPPDPGRIWSEPTTNTWVLPNRTRRRKPPPPGCAWFSRTARRGRTTRPLRRSERRWRCRRYPRAARPGRARPRRPRPARRSPHAPRRRFRSAAPRSPKAAGSAWASRVPHEPRTPILRQRAARTRRQRGSRSKTPPLSPPHPLCLPCLLRLPNLRTYAAIARSRTLGRPRPTRPPRLMPLPSKSPATARLLVMGRHRAPSRKALRTLIQRARLGRMEALAPPKRRSGSVSRLRLRGRYGAHATPRPEVGRHPRRRLPCPNPRKCRLHRRPRFRNRLRPVLVPSRQLLRLRTWLSLHARRRRAGPNLSTGSRPVLGRLRPLPLPVPLPQSRGRPSPHRRPDPPRPGPRPCPRRHPRPRPDRRHPPPCSHPAPPLLHSSKPNP